MCPLLHSAICGEKQSENKHIGCLLCAMKTCEEGQPLQAVDQLQFVRSQKLTFIDSQLSFH